MGSQALASVQVQPCDEAEAGGAEGGEGAMGRLHPGKTEHVTSLWLAVTIQLEEETVNVNIMSVISTYKVKFSTSHFELLAVSMLLLLRQFVHFLYIQFNVVIMFLSRVTYNGHNKTFKDLV